MGRRVAMRADASVHMGTGHVARCLTLAEQIRARGGTVCVLGRHLPVYLQEWVRRAGHDYVDLPDSAEPPGRDLAHAAWLGTSQAADAAAVVAALDGQAWDWMVVDHYALDARWHAAVQPAVGQVMAIDDLADRAHQVTVLLDQNLPAEPARYQDHVPAGCRLLLGPTYALVREEFRHARARVRPRRGTVTRVLVFVGGGDADNYTGRAVTACRTAGLGPDTVDVVVGSAHPEHDQLARLCAEAGYRLHRQTSEMAALMAAADFAIGASGSASWERCAVGLPALTFATAANQEPILEGLRASGAILTLPVGTPVTADTLAEGLAYAQRHPAEVGAVSEAAWTLVDGGGAGRVCDVMEAA